MKNIAFIFARGGSKSVPRKNVKNFCGKPLITYSIETALDTPEIDEVYVSTDDREIKEISLSYGAKIIKRPKELATDHSPEWISWQHAIETVKEKGEIFDKFVSLPPTSPLRCVKDVSNCIYACDKLVNISISITQTSRSPWFNMVKKDDSDRIELINKNDTVIHRRQDTPVAFDLTTVAYVAWPDFILQSSCIWDGIVKGVIIPQHRAIDIDTATDFFIAESLMKRKV